MQSLQHILSLPAAVHLSDLRGVAATLSQERNQSIDTFYQQPETFTFEVIERFLFDRGCKCTVASSNGAWRIDTPSFLKDHPGFLGLISTNTFDSYIYRQRHWETRDGKISLPEMSQQIKTNTTVVVHKMWTPLERFYLEGKPFHITGDDTPYTRLECQPTSCWRSELVNYQGHLSTVKKYMKEHRRSQLMMSNGKEIVLCRPTSSGWNTSTILNYQVVPMVEISREVSEALVNKVVEKIEENNDGWTILAHAMFSALQHLGGSISLDEFSSLSKEDLNLLRQYAEGLNKSTMASK